MRPARTPLGALFVLFLLVGCGEGSSSPGASSPSASAPPAASSSPEAAAFPVTITDDDGVSVAIDAEPHRIVTFAPSATEIVFALGLGDRLVGVSGPFDDHPAEATEIQEIGGAGDFGVDPNLEQVVALEPDLFLTIKGGDQWKERLRDLGVPVVTLDATDLDDLVADIEATGRITGATDAASALAADLQAEADEVEATVASVEPVTCFYETFYPPLYTVGPGTFIYDLLERAGCDPVTASATGQYPEWSVEDLVEQGPDVYLVSSESGASARAVARRAGFEAVEAVAAGRVFPIDSDLAERPGPRIVQGLRLLAEALHPEAFA
ncbi:MAG: ABC transporter substrate-binding protein [Actinomycetota bacterium]